MTTVSICEDKFHIDGAPTYAGRIYEGWPVEGLLLDMRMVQATYDDANEQTVSR